MASGLSVGFGGVAAGLAIGIVGDACVRAIVLEQRVCMRLRPGGAPLGSGADACVGWTRDNAIGRAQLFVGMVLILIFAEVLGLYGLIVSLILNSRASNDLCP